MRGLPPISMITNIIPYHRCGLQVLKMRLKHAMITTMVGNIVVIIQEHDLE